MCRANRGVSRDKQSYHIQQSLSQRTASYEKRKTSILFPGAAYGIPKKGQDESL